MARSITVGIGGASGRPALAWATEEAELGGAQLIRAGVGANLLVVGDKRGDPR
jgi:hypothetical protein